MVIDHHDNTNEDVKSFMQLIFENDRRIYAYIFVLIPNKAEADDLFQDTVTIMWEKFETFKTGTDFGAWGIGIAYNLIRNYRRKKARSRLLFEEDIECLLDHETKEALSGLDSKLEALRKCLHKLNISDKKILMLKYENNCSARVIAEKIGYSMKVVYVRLARANDFLLRCIRRNIAEQDIL